MIKLSEKNYVERDVSWMLFNRRILAEATLNHIVRYADKTSKDLRKRCEKTLKMLRV